MCIRDSFYPERDARLFLFQAHPHHAACIAGPQRVGDEVEQQLFGLIGEVCAYRTEEFAFDAEYS